ncbi:Clampless protein 1 [Psilocybe cubensis]|nr:Clampless protein 1 [Psilocybe cubensis]KAH9474442.1 Clampless protein 1 [Psilocybe cubensis]
MSQKGLREIYDLYRRILHKNADMFQVATHPTSFAMHGHGHHQVMHSMSPIPGIQLPRTLARPPFAEVSRDAIMAVAPELANVPPEYIRRGLRPKAFQMLAGISALPPSHLPNTMQKSQVPQVISIPIRSSSSTYPTHVLAVSSSKSSPNEHVFMFPVHNVIIAANCSTLPRLPVSSSTPTGMLQLPVLPLVLPSPAAFKVLHTYLYTHSLDAVLKSLFPLPSGFVQGLSHHTVKSTLASANTLHQLSNYLCSSAGGSLQVLTTHAAHVKELWQDMVALGLHDPELWDTIDLAWELILGALNIAASSH